MSPAPLVAAAAAPVAEKALAGVVKVLSTDIVNFEGRVFRRVVVRGPRTDKDGRVLFTKAGKMRMQKKEFFEPIEFEFHLNPIGLGILAVGGAAALWLLGLGIGPTAAGRPTIVKRARWQGIFLGGGAQTSEDTPIFGPAPSPGQAAGPSAACLACQSFLATNNFIAALPFCIACAAGL